MDRYVCLCWDIKVSQLEQAYMKYRDKEKVIEELGATTGCGSCHFEVSEIIERLEGLEKS